MAFRENSSYDSGIIMGAGGPMMSGTWQNPMTGHTFTVADCYLENNQMYVKTTTGQVLDYNMIQDYVQCTDEYGNHVSIPTQTLRINQQKKQPLPKEVSKLIDEPKNQTDNLMLPEDAEMVGASSGFVQVLDNITESTPIITYTSTEENPDEMMIKKVLDKKSIPLCNITADWDDVPAKQIETLIDILGVDSENIVDYYVERCMTQYDFMPEIKAKIHSIIADTIQNIVEMGAPDFMNSCEDRPYEELLEATSEKIVEPKIKAAKNPVRKTNKSKRNVSTK